MGSCPEPIDRDRADVTRLKATMSSAPWVRRAFVHRLWRGAPPPSSRSVATRVEIGRIPARDRSYSAARSVVFRVEIGCAVAGLLLAGGFEVRQVVFAP